MRAIPVMAGILLLLVGIVWILQGAGVLMGSFMSNNPTWFWIGTVTALVGLAFLAIGVRLPTRPRSTKPT